MMQSLGFVPVAWFTLQFTTFHFALQTSSQAIRLIFSPFLVLFTALSFYTADAFTIIPGLANLWAHGVLLNIAHAISVLFIERLPPLKPASIRATYRVWSNPQLLERKVYWDYDDYDEKGQPMAVFLFLRLSKLPLYYYFDQHVFPALNSEIMVDLTASDFAHPTLFNRFGDTTAREVLIRSHTVIWWIWRNIALSDGANAVLASVGVIVGQDRPSDWPGLFGSPIDACGLRNFWSRFWHRLAVRPYKNCGRVVSRSLGLKTRTAASKTATAFIIFFLSGLSHTAVSWLVGSRDWLDLEWFLLNFLGCLVETFALSLLKLLANMAGTRRELEAIQRSWFGYVFGYAWVFAFFLWSVPLMVWPRQYEQFAKAERWMRILSKMTIVPPGE